MNEIEKKVKGFINSPLKNLEIADVNTFTTDRGIKIRRKINAPVRKIFEVVGTKRKIHVERYPHLEKGENYVFISNHSFDEDIIATLSQLGCHAYVLIGTTNQLEYNPLMYAAWVNGLVYVNRLDPVSRSEALPKMERIINAGSSMLVFGEGGWDNTEHRPSNPQFAGGVLLAQNTNRKVVLVSSYNEHDSKDIYMSFSDPYDISKIEERTARREIANKLGVMTLEHMFNHASTNKRSDLEKYSPTGDIYLDYMEQRKKEYMRVKWSRDVWDEELTTYTDWEMAYPEEVRSTFDNVKVNANNAYVMAPVLLEREIDKEYDFKVYMKKNWNK